MCSPGQGMETGSSVFWLKLVIVVFVFSFLVSHRKNWPVLYLLHLMKLTQHLNRVVHDLCIDSHNN